MIKIGRSSTSLVKRIAEHNGAGYRIIRGYPTLGTSDIDLENRIKDYLADDGECKFKRRRGSSSNSEFYIFDVESHEAIVDLDRYIRRHHNHLFHACADYSEMNLYVPATPGLILPQRQELIV
jgi:hypothetical protein